jgi:ATP/maltotriose-dependent transcriptional regulator MalT/DNA-binding SARP family transcriptional activator
MEPMAQPDSSALIDTLLSGSVSFAPPDPSDLAAFGTAQSSASIGAGRLVSTPALLGGASRDGVSGYPIQVGKVQRPPLRDETLARHRLLDWLDVKIHNRVVFVIADAGYGKTTLLADFSRRTRLRTLWYRMDEEDRNWVTFLSYLVAAGREHEPGFAPRTHAMLQDTGPGGATRDEAVAVFLRELPDIAPTPTVLILDDYHVAEGSGDVSYVAKSLVTTSPERLTVVISSRRTPDIAVGRLRAQGELAELRTSDLQFSETEIADLFADEKGNQLDRESLGLLNRRSEGWAASLQLVRTAVRDRTRPEVRDFIRRLSGEQAELYDYLAEEVVGDLGEAHQQFLMRTSLLQVVTVEGASAICEVPERDARALVEQSEKLGLIAAQGVGPGGYRYHPLVREFLEGRLRSAVGNHGAASLHELAGNWAAAVDWREACYHFDRAGVVASLHRVLDSAIESIAGQGGYEVASEYLRRHPPPATASSFEIIASRMEYRRGERESAVRRADHAVALSPDSDVALNNSVTLHAHVGDHYASWDLAKRMATSARSTLYRAIASASCLKYESSLDGRLAELVDTLEQVLAKCDADELSHFAGVAHLNLSLAEHARGDSRSGLLHADLAVVSLAKAHKGDELASAYLARALSEANLGLLEESQNDVAAAEEAQPASARSEWLVEAAELEVLFGRAEVARALIEEARVTLMTQSFLNFERTVEARLALRMGEIDAAREIVASFEVGAPSELPGFMSRQLAIRAHVMVAQGAASAADLVNDAVELAERQGAMRWVRYGRILAALGADDPAEPLSVLIERTPDDQLSDLDACAELVCTHLAGLSDRATDALVRHASGRKQRWLPALRIEVAKTSASRWRAAEMLDQIGTADDIPALRALGRSAHASRIHASLGRDLARRLATRFRIEDLGRVEILAGGIESATTSVRRKVLAMLCFLLTKPHFSATRDEVIDALWPDLSPDVAINSLNQTVYFLRRVFEPGYAENVSAGYVHHSSDVLWLDEELISSRSSDCLALIDSIGVDLEPSTVARLSAAYTDRFALDFAYEEWAVPFRTSLHVGYLQIVEGAVSRDMASGHEDRAIDLARRALDRDPGVESLELALVRLYRTTGAHSAAAEQYEHYATILKDELGIEAPPLASL